MKRLILSVLLIFTVQSTLAQSTESSADAVVTGTVFNSNGQSVPNATVAIYNSRADTTNLVTGTSSENDGGFRLNVQPGEYYMEISYVSFDSYSDTLDLESGETVQIGEVTLTPSTTRMDEVIVRQEQSRMEMNFDSRTFDVGSDLTSMGGSALDVLSNVPSIATDIDGNISLRGNQSVRILVNGRPSNLVTGANALRSIPSYLIQEVEIITNPSARYSAEGSAGIINIIMKKDQRQGFNGSIGAGSGWPQNHEVSTNLNYRTENVNWFFGGGAEYSSEPEDGYSYREYLPTATSGVDTSYAYRENTEADESEMEGNVRFGADFFLTEQQTLTVDANAEYENGWSEEDVNFIHYQVNNGSVGDPMRRVLRSDEQDEIGKEFEANLEYENRIEGGDHRLTAEASYDIGIDTESSNYNETVLMSQNNYTPQTDRSHSEENSQNMRFEIDYVRPLGKNGEMEAGARSTFDWTDNSMTAEELINGSWQPVEGEEFNNNFLYDENINAVYTTVSKEFGSFSGSAGLRMEHTKIYTELTDSGRSTSQNYVGLFPSVFLNYSFNEEQSIQASYSRRLERPWSRQLLPFSDYSDPQSRFTGNPNLEPEYANSFEAGYLQYWGSGSLLTSLYYRHRTGVHENVTTVRNGIEYSQPVNLATEKAWGVEFSADQELFESLSITANANFYKSNTNGAYQGESLTSEVQSFQGRMTLRWRPTDKWNFQLSSNYQGPHNTTQGRDQGMAMMDAGLAHNFELWGGRATLSLNVDDLLNSQDFSATINNQNLYLERRFSWSSRTFMFNLRYNFNQFDQPQGGRGDYDGGGGDWD